MMSPYFDFEHPPLFPGGFHDIREEDLERIFADPFVTGRRRRNELCRKFRGWLKAVKGIGVPLEIWVDGSFATHKPKPNDVDILCIMDIDKIRSSEPAALKRFCEFFRKDAVKSKYDCHVFAARMGDFCDYNYWADYFGHSRSGTPKGIARIFLGGER